MGERTVCVGVVAYNGDNILLVEHTETARLPTGSHGFPAGRVEKDEDPSDTAIREFYEETGYTTTREYLHRLPEITSTLQMQNGTEDFTFIPFVCTKYSGEPKACDDNVPRWVKLDDLDAILLVSDYVKTISREWHGYSFP